MTGIPVAFSGTGFAGQSLFARNAPTSADVLRGHEIDSARSYRLVSVRAVKEPLTPRRSPGCGKSSPAKQLAVGSRRFWGAEFVEIRAAIPRCALPD